MRLNPSVAAIQTISVIVPANPFTPPGGEVKHCLAALDVMKLMEWWPGTPHSPHRDADKVRAVQRSLDWKRVTQIAAYLLQREIVDVPRKVEQYFSHIYGAKAAEPGREWPPRVPKVAKFQRSAYPTFANVLLHVNGASVHEKADRTSSQLNAAILTFTEQDPKLNFSVIDGQHRINGAYLAVCILREETPSAGWDIPSEIFLDLDELGQPPRRQAQIFIDVNGYQKKVDRSLVADLFPTARGRSAIDNTERAQDLGRRLMLETGPLVGMIQIPGIKYGVRDVVTLSTLNGAIEEVIDVLTLAGLRSLDAQTEFLALCLEAWLDATGRREEVAGAGGLDPENVAYQGRAIVTFLTLIPRAILWLQSGSVRHFVSNPARMVLTNAIRETMKKAGLLRSGKFLSKTQFREKGFLGSGGLGRFRDSLWAASGSKTPVSKLKAERLSALASEERTRVRRALELG